MIWQVFQVQFLGCVDQDKNSFSQWVFQKTFFNHLSNAQFLEIAISHLTMKTLSFYHDL